jgi:succinoglycan biosynthesis protein ExoW
MNKISVLIPFFQHDPGILKRAIASIIGQSVPAGWSVEVVVVDDASPCSAEGELRELTFVAPFSLKVIQRENGGVAAARNRALAEADPQTIWIAFLDSDDIWRDNHLCRIIQAHDLGFDFYFTDNCRPGFHRSHISEHAPETLKVLAKSPAVSHFVRLSTDRMIGLVIEEFPAQISAVAYRRTIAPNIRFDSTLKAAGEDVAFLSLLTSKAKNVGFDPEICVECGSGLNMYFSNIDWNSKRTLDIKIDQVRAHRGLARSVRLSADNWKINSRKLRGYQRELAFHLMRATFKFPGRIPVQILRLIRYDPRTLMMLPFHMVCVGIAKVLKRASTHPAVSRASAP